MLFHTTFKSIFKTLAISVGLITINITPLFAAPLQETLISLSKDSKEVSLRQVPPAIKNVFENGTYLYGQSSQPEEIGQEYMVFEVRQDRVVGAFYMPASEFACFSGTINDQAMNLSVVDPYENEAYPYTIALQNSTPVASNSEQLTPPVSLEGYKYINNISDNDRRILDICSQEF